MKYLSGRRTSAAPRTLVRTLLVALISLGAVACKDAPLEPRMRGQVPSATAVGLFMPSLEDARQRLIPALENKAISSTLGAHLNDLSQRLAAGDFARSRNSVDAAVQLADKYLKNGGAGSADVACVGAIQLVLYHASMLLNMQIDPALLPFIGSVDG